MRIAKNTGHLVKASCRERYVVVSCLSTSKQDEHMDAVAQSLRPWRPRVHDGRLLQAGKLLHAKLCDIRIALDIMLTVVQGMQSTELV